MMVKVRVLNKVFLVSLLIMSLYNCSLIKKEEINLNNILDYYITYYSKENNLNVEKNYLILGVSNNNKLQSRTVSIADGCYNCPGIISNEDTFIQYKEFKIVIISKNKEDEKFLLQNLSNIATTEKFSVKPLRKDVMYNFARHWEIEYNNKGRVSFVCMGEETKKLKNKLFAIDVESCTQ